MIQVEHLNYAYPGVDNTPGVAVFTDLSLTIEDGSFVAVLGSNGCGKSTLAKHFNAILLPTGGKVWVCGMDTSQEDRLIPVRRKVGMVFQNPDNQIVANVVEEDVAFGPENLGIASPEIRHRVNKALKQVGMVFQNPDNQIVANVVEEDVAFGPENLGVPSEEIRRRVDDALKAVGMDAFTLHAPHMLSGGQKQRIAIAGVIAMEPACIVLDEATAMLDPVGRREVLEIGRAHV